MRTLITFEWFGRSQIGNIAFRKVRALVDIKILSFYLLLDILQLLLTTLYHNTCNTLKYWLAWYFFITQLVATTLRSSEMFNLVFYSSLFAFFHWFIITYSVKTGGTRQRVWLIRYRSIASGPKSRIVRFQTRLFWLSTYWKRCSFTWFYICWFLFFSIPIWCIWYFIWIFSLYFEGTALWPLFWVKIHFYAGTFVLINILWSQVLIIFSLIWGWSFYFTILFWLRIYRIYFQLVWKWLIDFVLFLFFG